MTFEQYVNFFVWLTAVGAFLGLCYYIAGRYVGRCEECVGVVTRLSQVHVRGMVRVRWEGEFAISSSLRPKVLHFTFENLALLRLAKFSQVTHEELQISYDICWLKHEGEKGAVAQVFAAMPIETQEVIPPQQIYAHS